MNLRSIVFIALAAAALAGCQGQAGEPGPAGPTGGPGGSCAVVAEGDSRILRCPDGEVALLPDACTVESNEEVQTIRCGQGEPLVLHPNERAKPAGITGSVTRFGYPPSAGIEVEVLEIDRRVETDAAGHFEIGGIPTGLYRLRLSAPGYASLEIRDVIAAGNVVDVGERILRISRLVSNGLSEPMVSPDGTKVALLEEDFFGGLSTLSLLDLDTWERKTISTDGEIEDVSFLGDGHLLYVVRDWEPEIYVYDIEAGETEDFGEVSDWMVLGGGVLFSRIHPDDGHGPAEEPLRFLANSSSAPILVGEGHTRLDGIPHSNGRFAILEEVSTESYLLFDSENPEALVRLAGRGMVSIAPGAGHAAFFREDDEDGSVLSILDAGTGVLKNLGPADTASSLWWSPSGDHLATSRGTSYRVIETASSSEIAFESVAYPSLQLSPGGSLVRLTNWSASRLIQGATGEEWLLGSSRVAFSEDDRWVAALRPDRLELIDTSIPEDVQIVSGNFGYEFFFVGDVLLYVQGNEVVRLDPVAGEELRFPIASILEVNGGHILFIDTDLEVSILHVAEGKVSPTSIREVLAWDRDEESGSFFVSAGFPEALYRIHAADGTVTPIDDKVLGTEFMPFSGGFFYHRSELDLASVLANLAFDAVELRLVRYP